jgi:hypothetical protein
MASDNYSVFLESIKGASSASDSDTAPLVNPETAGKIIDALQKHPAGSEVAHLAKDADVDFFDFAGALQMLQKLDAVVVEGQGSTQTARLGSKWQDVRSLLK